MVSFLAALVFAPVLAGCTWIYVSPLRRLDGHTSVKGIIRIVLFVAIFGGMLTQLKFLVDNEPSNTSGPYIVALLAIDAIPILSILFYRDLRRRGAKPANHIDSSPSLGASEGTGQGVGSREVRMSGQRVQWLWVTSIVSLGIFVSRLRHEMQLNRLHLAVNQPYKIITLAVAAVLTGCVTALLRAYGIIKKE